MRVAHPSSDAQDSQLKKVRDQLHERSRANDEDLFADSDDGLSGNIVKGQISSKGVPNKKAPLKQTNPMLFDFEHYYDPELTPRKKYTQKLAILDAQLAEESQKFGTMKAEFTAEKAELEK